MYVAVRILFDGGDEKWFEFRPKAENASGRKSALVCCS